METRMNFFRSLLRRWSVAPRPLRRARLKLEFLEDRTTPAVIVPVSGSFQAQLDTTFSGLFVPVSGPDAHQAGGVDVTAISLHDAGTTAPVSVATMAITGPFTQ